MKLDTATGSVWVAALDISETKRNSFHDVRKAKIEEAARTAFEVGMITNLKIWNGVAPSMTAASSISRGISSKKPLIIQTDTARAKAEWLTISAVSVPSRPRYLKMT